MVQRSVPECFLIHYSATTKIRNMKMINNTKSFTLPFFLFMTNLPTMRGDHEHKKTTNHNWIPMRHNLWHNTHLSIKKYQNMAQLEPTSSHSLHKQHTNFLRNRTWSFTHSHYISCSTWAETMKRYLITIGCPPDKARGTVLIQTDLVEAISTLKQL